jgi:hypothetical protein
VQQALERDLGGYATIRNWWSGLGE